MYQYNDFDKNFVNERVAQFRAQVERRIDGSLSEDEFRPLRLMNGLYLQLHAYMLRVAIPYGALNSAQMRQLGFIADKWDKGYGHFTTRQNIQYNWPKLKDVPDMLQALAESACTPFRPAATPSATSPPTISLALPPMKSLTRARWLNCCANGQPTTRNSSSCRANSRSPSPDRPMTAP